LIFLTALVIYNGIIRWIFNMWNWSSWSFEESIKSILFSLYYSRDDFLV